MSNRMQYNPVLITKSHLYDIIERKNIRTHSISSRGYYKILDKDTILCQKDNNIILIEISTGKILQEVRKYNLSDKIMYLPVENEQASNIMIINDIPDLIRSDHYYAHEKVITHIIYVSEEVYSYYEYKDRSLKKIMNFDSKIDFCAGDRYLIALTESKRTSIIHIYDVYNLENPPFVYKADDFNLDLTFHLLDNKLISLDNQILRVYDISKNKIVDDYHTNIFDMETGTIVRNTGDHFYFFSISSKYMLIMFDSSISQSFIMTKKGFRKFSENDKYEDYMYLGGNKLYLKYMTKIKYKNIEEIKEYELENIIFDFVTGKFSTFSKHIIGVELISDKFAIIETPSYGIGYDSDWKWIINLDTLEFKQLDDHSILMPYVLDEQIDKMTKKIDKLMENYIPRNIKNIIAKLI